MFMYEYSLLYVHLLYTESDEQLHMTEPCLNETDFNTDTYPI